MRGYNQTLNRISASFVTGGPNLIFRVMFIQTKSRTAMHDLIDINTPSELCKSDNLEKKLLI